MHAKMLQFQVHLRDPRIEEIVDITSSSRQFSHIHSVHSSISERLMLIREP